jgi:hypothetical protein
VRNRSLLDAAIGSGLLSARSLMASGKRLMKLFIENSFGVVKWKGEVRRYQ